MAARTTRVGVALVAATAAYLAITYYVFEMVNERMGVDGLARYDRGNNQGKGGGVGGDGEEQPRERDPVSYIQVV